MARSVLPFVPPMKAFHFVAVIASLSACVGESGGPELSTTAAERIQGGVPDTTHTFAVSVIREDMGSTIALCTGVLLAPNLVATARHCVAPISATTIDCATTVFSAVYPTSALVVATAPTLDAIRVAYHVSDIVVPPDSGACGNDIALMILSENIVLPQYVTPTLNPPMTDHRAYSTSVAEIGFGVDTPADTMGTSSGTRRIIENVNLLCIPNDPTFVDCFADPAAKQVLSANEFETTGGACEGDSGSGAYDQRSFDAGQWVAFGVLSRGGTDTDAELCTSEVYTRFDAWAQLITDTASRAATQGAYPLPVWAGGPSSTADAAAADANACLANGSACNGDTGCCSVNCLSHDNGVTFLCATCDANNPCNQDYGCVQGRCVMGAASSALDSGPAIAVDAALVSHALGARGGSGCTLTQGSNARGSAAEWGPVIALAMGARARRRSRKAGAAQMPGATT